MRTPLKIAHKLMLASGLMSVVTIGSLAAWQLQQTDALVRQEVEAEQRLLADTAAAAVRVIWADSGWVAAVDFLEDVERTVASEMELRWVWLDDERPPYTPRVNLDILRSLVANEHDDVSFDLRTVGEEELVYYRPLQLPGLPLGAIEVTRSTGPLTAFSRTQWRFILGVAAIFALLLALVTSVTGRLFVTSPLERVIHVLRALGRGDLLARVGASGRDEMSRLGHEVDEMGDLLFTAWTEAERERESRVAVESQLRHADRLVTVATLASAYIHDAGTPLSVISGNASLILAEDDLDDEVRELTLAIAQETRTANALLRRLMQQVRAQPETSDEPVELEALLDDSARLLEPLARRHGVRLRAEIDASLEDREETLDAVAVTQIVNNLVVNAIQASERGDEVVIRGLPRDDGGFAISVVDEGVGIPQDVLARVFDAYFTTKPAGVGTGLGLFMVKTLAERLDAEIEIESTVDVGTTITLLFAPRAAHASSLDDDDHPPIAPRAETRSRLDRALEDTRPIKKPNLKKL